MMRRSDNWLTTARSKMRSAELVLHQNTISNLRISLTSLSRSLMFLNLPTLIMEWIRLSSLLQEMPFFE